MRPRTGSVVVTFALIALSSVGVGTAPASAADKQNGEAKRSPAQVIADGFHALAKANSFTVTGSISVSGQPTLTVDLVVTRGHGGGGSADEGNGTVSFVVAAPNTYFRADQTYWHEEAGLPQATAQLLADKWLRVRSTTNKLFASYTKFVDVNYWSKGFGDSAGGHLQKRQRVFHGTPVVAVHQTSVEDPGTLLVAATETPYALAWVPDAPDYGAKGLVFGNFNSASPPAAPTGAVDLPNS